MAWTCGACTFENPNDAAKGCEICETPRQCDQDGRSDPANNDDDHRAVQNDDKGERKCSSRAESLGASGRKLDVAEVPSHRQQPSNVDSTTTTTATTRKSSVSTLKGGGNFVQRTLMGARVVPPVDKQSKKGGKKRSRVEEDPPDAVDAKDASSSSSALSSSRPRETRPLDSDHPGAAAVASSSLNVPSSSTTCPSNFFDMERKQQRTKDIMARVFGISKLRGLQSAAVQCVFEGKNQIVVMATGAGKSLCYQLPALVLGGTTIVVSPLIALMEDQVQALHSKGVAAAVLASSKSDTHNRTVLERLVGRPMFQSQANQQLKLKQTTISKSSKQENSGLKPLALVYCTPEQVQRTQFRAILQELYKNSVHRNSDKSNERPKTSHHYLSLIAIDEAHCVSTWGHDFRPAYRNLEWLTTALPRVPVIACTATATQQVLQDISQCLGLSPQSSKLHVGSLDRTNVFYRVAHVDALQFRHEQRSASSSQRRGALVDPIRKHLLSHINKMHARSQEQNLKCAGIIYCRKREHTIELTNWINQQRKQSREPHNQTSAPLVSSASTANHPIRAVAYHGGLSVKDRSAAQEGWTSGEYQVVVATSAFGMGIDVSHVRYVVHWCMPQSIEAFYQESGRAGRDGEPAHSLLYVSHDDVKTLRFIVSQDRNQQLAPRKLAALEKMVDYATKPHCRRGHLLLHFGVTQVTNDLCQGKCDYCANPDIVKRDLEQAAAAQQSNPFQIRRHHDQRKPEWDGQWDRPHGDTEEEDDAERDLIFEAASTGLGITTSVSDSIHGSADDGSATRKGDKHVKSILAKYEAIELQQNQKNGFVHFCRKGPSVSNSQANCKVPDHFRQIAPKLSHPASSGEQKPVSASVSSATFASEAERLRAELLELRAQQAAAVQKRDALATSSSGSRSAEPS